MIEVPDQVILDSLAHMPPYESVARAMREVLCLRQQLREIAQEQVRSAWPKRRG